MIARYAIVTGATRRLGRVFAEGLLADGWQVLAHVHDAHDEVPEGAIRVAADLADPECAERIFAACPEPPQLLVNNASRFALDSLEGFSPAELAQHMAVNVAAPALLTAAFARAGAAVRSPDRLVVNILDAKIRAPNADFLSYTLSKAALSELTKLSARQLAPKGIRVNAIAPALMLQSPGQSAENFAGAHAFNPLGRGVEPADALRALRFLRDTPVITGETILLDGGQRFWSLDRDIQFLDLSSTEQKP
jgi:NAD(P)-dependent dehydrogenase (short-subunit alcohol dehydrogenase family)